MYTLCVSCNDFVWEIIDLLFHIFTFGKYNPANKNVEGTAIEHVQKITLYSRLLEEIK